ncbi:class I SAM-dependent methyltransferase [Rhodohalobacter sp. SW132]|nr:class I SAM-dependent methyltransferase [Rhodohalobacter sp. SW132]
MEVVRDYYLCSECRLIFVPPSQRLSVEEEFSRYEMHENNPGDPGYRKFLSRMFNPLVGKLPEKSSGLDFGSGPGPTLHLMFESAGHSMKIYDPFYAKDLAVFDETYDFITTTETAEHLYDPWMELNRLWNCLKPGGYLGVMTRRWTSVEKFKKWHYKNDDTHVIFFHEDTFHWLKKRWGAELDIYKRDVVIFRKGRTG